MAVTTCWAVKGGSGTTVIAASLALTTPTPSLLVDLAGDIPAVLGLPEPDGQGITDWLTSDAPPSAVLDLAVDIDAATAVVPRGRGVLDVDAPRWPELLAWLATAGRTVVVDAGTGRPPAGLSGEDVRLLLVTRACYISLRRAATTGRRPDGVVLVMEHGRVLRAGDVERAIGAPVVATVMIDPAIARAVDCGLLAARLPRAFGRELGRVA